MPFSSEKKGQRVGAQRVRGLITVPLAVKCNGVSVCNKPEMEGGGHWEAGMTLEFSGTRVNRNGATRTLGEMVVENQGRGRANHQGWVGRWEWRARLTAAAPGKGAPGQPWLRPGPLCRQRRCRPHSAPVAAGYGLAGQPAAPGPRPQGPCAAETGVSARCFPPAPPPAGPHPPPSAGCWTA